MIFIKLQNGAYVGVDENSYHDCYYNFLIGMHALRTPKSSLVITGMEDPFYLRHLLEEKNLHFDKLVLAVTRSMSKKQKRRLTKFFGSCFAQSVKNIVYIEVAKWMSQYSTSQIDWFINVIDKMFSDNRFLLGQISMRKQLEEIDERIISLDRRLTNLKKNLEELKTTEESNLNGHTVDNINKMKWIDRLSLTNHGLSILTKPMACTHVPNISEFIDVNDIRKNDMLYRIMKYQFLGKYFIALPDYYVIENNYNFKADVNDKYTVTPSRRVIQNGTWFHGMIPHAGNNNACLGELSGSISQADKTGLDIYLMSIEAYIRSINLTDIAGQRFFVLPMGDENGNIEVWPFVENFAKCNHVSMKDLDRSLEGYDKFLRDELRTDRIPYDTMWHFIFGNSQNYIENNRQSCLELIEQREPEVYKTLVEKGVVGA